MAGPGKRGATLKMDTDRVAKILQYIKTGLPPHRAAAATGITERTHFNWIRRGRELLAKYEHDLERVPTTDPEYAFAHYETQIEQAQAEGEARLVMLISNEAPKTWTAAAWMLERTRPETYGRRERVDQNVNANVTHTYTEAVEEAWRQRRQKTAASEEQPGDGSSDD